MKGPRPLWLFLLYLGAISCAGEKNQPAPPAQGPSAQSASAGLEVKDRLEPGKEFPRLTVADQMGNRYELYNLLSKPINLVLVLDAFCPACGEEAEKIQKFAARGSELNIIGVSKDSLPAVLAFKRHHGLQFPILLDVEKKLVPDYRRVVFPTLVLVGPDKKIARLYEGGIPPAEAGPFLKILLGR